MKDTFTYQFRAQGGEHPAGRVRSLAGWIMALAVALLASGIRPAEATALKGAFSGVDFGTYANAAAGPVFTQLGKTAVETCPCRGTNGQVLSNTVTSAKAGTNGSILSAGVAVGTVYTQKTDTTATIQDTSTVNGLNLFGGLITATAIKSVATVNATTTTLGTSSTGSTLVDLVIDGNPIAADVSANTIVSLPGIGTVSLKKISRTGDAVVDRGITVQMLVVTVSQVNVFNLPVGAQIVVASANSYFTRNQPTAVVSGEAYAA